MTTNRLKMKLIIRYFCYTILLIISILTIYISLFYDSFLLDGPTSFIYVLGISYEIVFAVIYNLLDKPFDFSIYQNLMKEHTIELSTREFVNIIYISFLKSGWIIITYGCVNLLLALLNIVFKDYISPGNIIFSAILFWPLFGILQIRREIKTSIYYNSRINQVINHDSIEIISTNLHQKIKFSDLTYLGYSNNWTVFQRKKFDDYILIKS